MNIINAEIILQEEIARELLYQEDPTISEEEIAQIWEMCKRGSPVSPFDAPILYRLLQIAKTLK